MSQYPTDKQNKHFIEPYLRYAERKFIRKKTILFQQDKNGQGFYFIKDGFVKITTTDYKKNTRILDISTSGTIIGELVLNGMPYIATATVIKDSILYYFSIQTYNKLTQDYPEIKNLVANSILDKVKLLLSDINVKSNPTENQVAFCLLKLIDIYNDVKIDVTQQELSDYTGLTRITIYKILKKWEEDGILQIKNRKIHIFKTYNLKQYMD